MHVCFPVIALNWMCYALMLKKSKGASNEIGLPPSPMQLPNKLFELTWVLFLFRPWLGRKKELQFLRLVAEGDISIERKEVYGWVLLRWKQRPSFSEACF